MKNEKMKKKLISHAAVLFVGLNAAWAIKNSFYERDLPDEMKDAYEVVQKHGAQRIDKKDLQEIFKKGRKEVLQKGDFIVSEGYHCRDLYVMKTD